MILIRSEDLDLNQKTPYLIQNFSDHSQGEGNGIIRQKFK